MSRREWANKLWDAAVGRYSRCRQQERIRVGAGAHPPIELRERPAYRDGTCLIAPR